MPTGRPSKYTDAKALKIIAGLAQGTPLTVICEDDDMPTDETVRNWAKTNDALSLAIAHARVIGHDAIAHRARQTARGKTEDEGGDSSGDVQRDKLIVDTDLKLLAKWDPKRYGDKIAHVGGNPEDPPIAAAVTVEFVKAKG